MFTFSGVWASLSQFEKQFEVDIHHSPGNHSITQSSFESPCDPLGNGFDSGNIFIPDTTGGFPTWNLTITNTSAPIWFFCKQLAPQPHCDVGMVGSINAPSTGNTFDAFQAAARAHQGNSGESHIIDVWLSLQILKWYIASNRLPCRTRSICVCRPGAVNR